MTEVAKSQAGIYQTIDVGRKNSHISSINDEISLNDFEIIEEIGSGTNGVVYKSKFISPYKQHSINIKDEF